MAVSDETAPAWGQRGELGSFASRNHHWEHGSIPARFGQLLPAVHPLQEPDKYTAIINGAAFRGNAVYSSLRTTTRVMQPEASQPPGAVPERGWGSAPRRVCVPPRGFLVTLGSAALHDGRPAALCIFGDSEPSSPWLFGRPQPASAVPRGGGRRATSPALGERSFLNHLVFSWSVCKPLAVFMAQCFTGAVMG